MRVLLLNQTFYPDLAATAQHGHDLARHLVRQGHQVVVVTSRSLYGAKGASLPRREVVDGIEIHRVGFSLFGKSGVLLRAVDFAFFYVVATLRVLTLRRVDGVVCFTTPPMIALVGWLNRLVKRTPYVYWLMDLYPDLAVACGVMKRGGIAERVFEVINGWCLRQADRVVVLGRCMRERVVGKGVEPGRVELISVWADGEEVRPVAPPEAVVSSVSEPGTGDVSGGVGDSLSRGPGCVVMYSGNLGVGHEIETMGGAIEALRERADIRFVFVGGGKRMEAMRRFVEARGLKNVDFRGYAPRERLSESLGAGDVHLISQLPALTGMIVPSKLFGVMAAARPVVFIGDAEAEVGRVVMETGCGEVVSPGDVAALRRAIERLAGSREARQAQGEAGRAALEQRYDRSVACAAWERLLMEVTGGTRPTDRERGAGHAAVSVRGSLSPGSGGNVPGGEG